MQQRVIRPTDQQIIMAEFSPKQEAKINAIFGLKFIKNVKELRDLLINRNEHLIGSETDAWIACSHVIRALKKDPILENDLRTCEFLINNLVNDPIYYDDVLGEMTNRDYPYSDSKTTRLFAKILVGISAAYAGFKAGAAIGAVVGGGVFSVPSAVVGGCFGAFVGGIVGIFAGSKAHTFFRPNEAEEAIIYDKSASINKGLVNRPNRTLK